MQRYTPGMGPYEDVKAMLADLGLAVGKEVFPAPGMVESNVRSGNRKLARLCYSHSVGYASFRVMPVDPDSHQIMAGGGHLDNPAKVAAVLTDIESLFRAHMVRKGKLGYDQFPSDRLLRSWLDSVVETCGPEGQSKFQPKSSKAVAAYRAAEGLVAAYDRPVALRLQKVLASMDAGSDRPLRLLCGSASSMADTVFSRCVVAWDTGSAGLYLVTGTSPAPERQPVTEDEAEHFGMGR